MPILFMLSYNSITVLLCLETWKIHFNNTSVGLQEYIWKSQFTFICTPYWRSKRPEAIERGRLKCCLQFSLLLSFQKAKIIIILAHSSPVDLFVSWIVSFLFMAFPRFCHLPCSRSLTVKAGTCFLCGAMQELLNIMNMFPQRIWQCTTLHKLVTSLCGGGPEEIVIKVPKEYLLMTSGKKNPLLKVGQLRNMLNGSKSSYNKLFQQLVC